MPSDDEDDLPPEAEPEPVGGELSPCGSCKKLTKARERLAYGGRCENCYNRFAPPVHCGETRVRRIGSL